MAKIYICKSTKKARGKKATVTKQVSRSCGCPCVPPGVTSSSFIYSCLKESGNINNCCSPVKGLRLGQASPNDYETHDEAPANTRLGLTVCRWPFISLRHFCTLSLPERPITNGKFHFPFSFTQPPGHLPDIN